MGVAHESRTVMEAVQRMKVEMNLPGVLHEIQDGNRTVQEAIKKEVDFSEVLDQVRDCSKTIEEAVQRVNNKVDFTAVINEIRESRTKTVVDPAPVVQEIGRVKKEVAHESRTVMEEAVQRMKVEMNLPGVLHEIQ